jgi:hypothetical protein
MDFIDTSNTSQSQPLAAYCPNDLCGGEMFLMTKGKLEGNYVCVSCGMTVDPTREYFKHEDDLSSKMDDANDDDGFSGIVQADEKPKRNEHLDAIELEMKAEIEKGGRKQLVAISSDSATAFAAKNPNNITNTNINKIKRTHVYRP